MLINFISKLLGHYTILCSIMDELKSDKIINIDFKQTENKENTYIVYSLIFNDNKFIIKCTTDKWIRIYGSSEYKKIDLVVNNSKILANKKLLSSLYNLIKIKSNYQDNIINETSILIFTTQSNSKQIKEIAERFDEFEIIKNYDIDFISLQSLFEFYNVRFNEAGFKKRLKYVRKHH